MGRGHEGAIGNRIDGAQGGGGVAIFRERWTLATVRGGKEKHNNQQLLMGGAEGGVR